MARAFVIRPFGKKKDSAGREIDFDRTHEELIGPALQEFGFGGGTTGEINDAGNIRDDMFSLILAADLVVCDITVNNANVYYELGVRHSLRKKRTLMIRGRHTSDNTPFDILTDRYLEYDLTNPSSSLAELRNMIRAAADGERTTDSPVFRAMPTLREADVSANGFGVPTAFQDDVKLAVAGRSKGWLRLLADEVERRPFFLEGLRLVAKAQFELKDFDGARSSWEAIRRLYPLDVDANFALANIYERLSRPTATRPDLDLSRLAASDAALRNVLESVTGAVRAEAYALNARNLKTKWRMRLRGTGKELRASALNDLLRQSYHWYRRAFYQDLNHFYSGVAALQCAVILDDLSSTDPKGWANLFDSRKTAAVEKDQLENEVISLACAVRASLEASKQRPNGTTDQWLRLTEADLTFLSRAKKDRVLKSYDAAIPMDSAPFFWDAAKGQLELFSMLDIRRKIADAVIGEFAKRSGTTQEKPIQVIMFAGHGVDHPARTSPRFPRSKQAESRARQLIALKLESLLQPNHEYLAYASGAPGADILFHEICLERRINSTLCLPMPAKNYAGQAVFEGHDEWRNRFLDLSQRLPVLHASDRAGLPSWLNGAGTNPWERGNRWVLKMALAQGAKVVSLLVLWDNKPADGPGGIAHMVELARESGGVQIHTAEASPLLDAPLA
jgi:hypothetical protein